MTAIMLALLATLFIAFGVIVIVLLATISVSIWSAIRDHRIEIRTAQKRAGLTGSRR